MILTSNAVSTSESSFERGAEIEIFVLDEAHDLAPVGKAVYFGNRYIVELTLPNYTSYLLKVKKL